MAQIKDTDDFWDEYDYDNNPPIEEVNVRKDNVQWICRKDPRHVWNAKITNRRTGQGCAVCAGKKVIAGVNDFASQFPDAAAQWDYDKNNMSPSEVTPYSNKKAAWKCELGHTWEATVANRANGNGCPYCAGKKVWAGFNDLATENPELAAEWSDRNELSPTEVTSHSSKKIWWKCPKCGHEYQATPNARSGLDSKKATGCPCCANRVIVMGVNDLATTDPELAKEYVYEKNPPLDKVKFHEKVWWRCKEGHEFQQDIYTRRKSKDCPVCQNKIVIAGVNDLATTHPELCEEWDYEKNDILPTEVSFGSNRIVWWKCSKCHQSYQKKITARRGKGCVFCAHQRPIPGENDLATTNPELLDEWDYEKTDISPNEVFATSPSVSVWWKCPNGHPSYKMSPYDHFVAGKHCPVCSNQRIIAGINDLATLHPEIAAEWDYERNSKAPEEVAPGSGYQAYWICSRNSSHTWRARVVDRKYGRGCPHCAKARQTSKSEQAVYLCLKEISSDAINRYKIDGKKEVDVFIPSMNIAIEYDGSYYHQDKKKDLRKDEICKSRGIKLYRIREPGLPALNSTSIEIVREGIDLGHGLNEAIEALIEDVFCVHVEIDTMNMLNEILSDLHSDCPNALSKYHPVLAVQWDCDKNFPLTPEQVSYSARDKFWWTCPECGHSWQATPHVRAKAAKTYGKCPKCGNVPKDVRF